MDQHNFICPITHQVFSEPVLADDGNIYEREAIEARYKEKRTSPITRERMSEKVVPVNFIKSMIGEYLEKNPDLKARQYIITKDFKRYRAEIFDHIKNHRFNKLTEYTNYVKDQMLEDTLKITINELEFEIPYLKYLLKHCKDEAIINYIIENLDEMTNTVRLFMAEYSSEEMNMKYVDKNNYHSIKSHHSWNPLHFFVKRGFVNVIEAIGNIHTFKKFDMKTKHKYTPLMMAIKYNQNIIPIFLKFEMPITIDDIKFGIRNKLNYDVVKSLYDYSKAKINDKITQLSVYICRYGKYNGYKEFLKYMSNMASYKKDTVKLDCSLIVALCKYASDEILKIFIDQGFSVNVLNDDGHCGWMRALQLRRFGIFRYMIPKIDFTVKSNNGSSMIHWLAQNANELIKEMTDKYEFDYNNIADDMTPLMFAIEYNTVKVCGLLIEKGADVNIQLNTKNHLISAIEYRPLDSEFLKLLISKCNNFETSCNGKYPIHSAGCDCTPEIIKLMVDLNVNLESLTPNNRKLIHILCQGPECDDLIKYLIDVKKVSVDDYDNFGMKPMHYVFLYGSIEMIDYMKQKTKNHNMNLEMRQDDIPEDNQYLLKYKSLTDLLMDNPNVRNMVNAMFEID
ncbi:ankyrin repeat protein [Klosneuvirus KNV1]|uniref:Ankyrin repeat protein n=1 Tax=Klosneuvirus KNV1 TaxID=1977640 RepID=A0A1V0SJZ1_9VIRU|nr:ankyrin repeat protein [Klosneuvirus KNV1]